MNRWAAPDPAQWTPPGPVVDGPAPPPEQELGELPGRVGVGEHGRDERGLGVHGRAGAQRPGDHGQHAGELPAAVHGQRPQGRGLPERPGPGAQPPRPGEHRRPRRQREPVPRGHQLVVQRPHLGHAHGS